ncbi:hypothetical protein [Pyrodictium abyssi]|uniref:Uncharacterized protein n=1 Tax=Pyrodictium abyssi TaxID=54256 RepID=A0ABM8IZA4_9CREN|nr:hypothetical protein PABY_24440 [Pyrodictium abyssi]
MWNKLFTELAGIASTSDREVDIILNELKAISIHRWGEVRAIFADIGERVSNLYRRKKDKIISYIEKVFGFKRFFTKLYVVYGFNPMPGMSFGTMLYFDDENPVTAVYVNDLHGESHVLDLAIHELLHGLIRLNSVELEHDIEELVIDVSAPDGYLSKIIGLVDRANARLENVLYFQREAERYKRLFDLLVEYCEKRSTTWLI